MEADGFIPQATLESLVDVKRELSTLEQQFNTLLPLLNPATLAVLSPLQQASSFLCLSKAVNALFTLHLKCKGLSIHDLPASSEVERVNLYEDKIAPFIEKNEAPKFPTSVLDVQAANRFIEHAIPNLTEEQKNAIRGIGKTAAGKSIVLKHGVRKSRSSTNKPVKTVQSVTEAVAAFLEEAKKELVETHKVQEI